MHITTKIMIASLIVICMGGVASAESWRVEQLGIGDFTVIQDAVDAAADGDTILIGPGHYQEMHDYQPHGAGYFIQTLVSWDDHRALTFIGSGPDEVIFGPDTFEPNHTGPTGITYQGSQLLLVSGISFQNFYTGIYSNGGCRVDQCHFSDSQGSVAQLSSGLGSITNCEFYRQQVGGLGVGVWGAAEFTIENCFFEDVDFYLQGVPDATVTNCEFVGYVGSFTASNGVFSNNQATIGWSALNIQSGSQVLVQDCVFSVFSVGTKNLSIYDSGTFVELSGNIFNGGTYAALKMLASPTVIGSGNHFFKGDSSYTIVVSHSETPNLGSIDLRNNYWGTDDPALVGLWIYDGADDPDIALEVQYEPIADGPLPTSKTSLDGLKAMFR
jgi:hypothetical protein